VTAAPDPVVSAQGDRTGAVTVTARREAGHVLFDKGLANAPYPECDMWARPGGVLARPAEHAGPQAGR
jgi:hypothetical protein